MSSAWHTPIYKVAVLSCILLTGYLVSQITILDYLSNPYNAPPLYFRNLLIANYGFHLLSSIVVAFLFVMRIQEFYKDRIKFMIGMYSFFFLFATFKGTGGVAGMHILLKNVHEPQKRLSKEQPVIRKVQSKQSSLALDNNALKAPIVHRIRRSDSISRPKNSLQNNRDDDIVFVEFPLHRSQSTLFSPGVQEDEVKFWDEEDYSYYAAHLLRSYTDTLISKPPALDKFWTQGELNQSQSRTKIKNVGNRLGIAMRNENAYETPAAIFLGLGLHKLFESLFLVASKLSTAWHTPIYKVAVLSWMLLAGYLVSQITILDYLTSPYDSAPSLFGNLLIANYGFNLVTSIVIAIMFIMRIRVFYRDNFKFMISMYGLFSLIVAFKGTGGLVGVIVGFDVASLKYEYLTHPLYHIIPFLLGFGQFFEAIFATVGSVGFIYALISNQDEAKMLIDIIIKEDGIQFSLLVLVDWFIACFGIYSWATGGYTYVTHVGLCKVSLTIDMGSYSFGLQLYIFLKNSYITPKQIFKGKLSSRKPDSKRDSVAADVNVFEDPAVNRSRKRDSLNTSKVPLINRDDDQLIIAFPPQRSHSSLFVTNVQEETESELEFWDVDDYNYTTPTHRLTALSEPFIYSKYT
ncbi:hypothetical protein HDV04_005478 [Boothiomyces sp. JEL0838]|nr:hypothetical protein HDV04_005478 [Boothiomyces sp. JEL0838]